MECFMCGACCKQFNEPDFPKDEAIQQYNDGTGVCINLKNNKCVIYEDRPIFCNHKKLFEALYSQLMPQTDYEELITSSCKKLRKLTK